MVDMSDVIQHIRSAAVRRTPCVISTVNLNYLISSRRDSQFRHSVINSDLSFADGMTLVWIARILGIPIPERVAGSDMFVQLRAAPAPALSVYFFGGKEGVAETACRMLNTEPSGLACAGFESPGFGSVKEMSHDESIEKINASDADFLIVSLGAQKAQAWIQHNRARISVPVISNLGATINFLVGSVKRAPIWIRRSGLEWLWRIKEEPGLWHRYASDGLVFLKLLMTRVIPYAWLIYRYKPAVQELDAAVIELFDDGCEYTIHLSGAWEQDNLMPLRECFSNSAIAARDVRIDLEKVTYIDSAFIGLLLLLYNDKMLTKKGLYIIKLNKNIRQIFHYSCAEFLLDIP